MPTTNWFVITGAPSSGKTTLLKELEKKGHRVVHEVARSFIETKLQQGATLEEIRADKYGFEHAILSAKISMEKDLPLEDVVFFDRAVPDSIAYFKIAGLNPKEVIAHCQSSYYRKIFLLDRLPLEPDHVRSEESLTAERLDLLLEQSYASLGYGLVRIPVMPVRKRLETILDIAKRTLNDKWHLTGNGDHEK